VKMTKHHATLTITNVTESDSGSYRLRLKNGVGKSSARIQIQVNG
jgi:hypothetical protein